MVKGVVERKRMCRLSEWVEWRIVGKNKRDGNNRKDVLYAHSIQRTERMCCVKEKKRLFFLSVMTEMKGIRPHPKHTNNKKGEPEKIGLGSS